MALRANPDTSPVVLAYEPAEGPIYCVDFSPFHRNLFLVCGADGTVRMYHQYQSAPCLTVTPPLDSASETAAPLLSVKWSPKRPLVFAVCTANGLVCLYDLFKRLTDNILWLELSYILHVHPCCAMGLFSRLIPY